MSDNILTAVLTFSLLAGGTAAIGSEMFHTPKVVKAPVVVMPMVTVTAQRAAEVPEVVTMPMVTITAQRAAAEPAEVVTMPMVVVTGRREAVTVAVESHDEDATRVQ